MNKSIKRFVILKKLSISFLHTCVFPACCIRQRTFGNLLVFFYLDVAQGL